MTISQPEIKTFNYTGGKDFTTRLLTVTGASNLSKLAQLIGVPRTTIATSHRRDMIQHEIIVRICLVTEASLRYLTLDEGERFKKTEKSSIKTLLIEKRLNRNLETKGHIPLNLIPLEEYNLEESSTTVVEQKSSFFFVNTLETNTTLGKYLIDIDSSLSINHLYLLLDKNW
ncbi:Bacteriophage CI repressor helix-turn-helix domain protein [Photobacterium piscicola]|uniref:Bacteriophage CI repressor helix-turn-helix domain protein n=1 Tax=Photobacterium piscicola TaxID=1378299 RepID=A0A1T5HXP3_9GAMM|nr:helix-turn-helix domain-containing protein [Photobacterium piscicola]SKC31466.1 Bacteriophage CI repressor helix-turn-helix domain protein [Photobacterium piscicola]